MGHQNYNTVKTIEVLASFYFECISSIRAASHYQLELMFQEALHYKISWADSVEF